jgi:DNA-binding SARP family transcriptional activator
MSTAALELARPDSAIGELMGMPVPKESGADGLVHQSRLTLLAEFQLRVSGTVVRVPRGSVSRSLVAATLWPDVDGRRANGNLRSALWRLRRVTEVIQEDYQRLALAPQVSVDVTEMVALTASLISTPEAPHVARLPELVGAHAILPGWDEDWLIVERERFRLNRLRALEQSAEWLLTNGWLSEALDAALATLDAEPYRESGHRLVVRIHIDEGNPAEAVRAYEVYRAMVAVELGISPSPLMDQLVAPFVSPSGAAPRG